MPELQLIVSDTIQLVPLLTGADTFQLAPFLSILKDRDLPGVLSPTRLVSREHAQEFCVQFYESLADGSILQEAFERARTYVEVLYPPGSGQESSSLRARIETLIIEDKLEGAFDLLQGAVRESQQKDLEVSVPPLQYRRLSNLEKKIKGGRDFGRGSRAGTR